MCEDCSFIDMNLTKKEIEFLIIINEAEEMGSHIAFYENDHEKIKEFREQYGNVYKSLSDKLLISGNIDYFCYLILTKTGKKVLEKILSEKRNKKEGKKSNKPLIWTIVGVIVGISGIIISIFLYKQGT